MKEKFAIICMFGGVFGGICFALRAKHKCNAAVQHSRICNPAIHVQFSITKTFQLQKLFLLLLFQI